MYATAPRPLVVHIGQDENAVPDGRSQEPPHTLHAPTALTVTLTGHGEPLVVELGTRPARVLLTLVWRLVRRDLARVVPS